MNHSRRAKGTVLPSTPHASHLGPLHLWRRITALWIPLLFQLMLPAVVQAQFNFTTNNGTITITGYTGTNLVVTIPSSTNGLPIVTIGDYAFKY